MAFQADDTAFAESLLASVEGEPHTRIRYFCSPHHTHSPLYPLIVQLERAAGFKPGSSAGAKLDKLEALLKPTARNVPRDLALIAAALSTKVRSVANASLKCSRRGNQRASCTS